MNNICSKCNDDNIYELFAITDVNSGSGTYYIEAKEKGVYISNPRRNSEGEIIEDDWKFFCNLESYNLKMVRKYIESSCFRSGNDIFYNYEFLCKVEDYERTINKKIKSFDSKALFLYRKIDAFTYTSRPFINICYSCAGTSREYELLHTK